MSRNICPAWNHADTIKLVKFGTNISDQGKGHPMKNVAKHAGPFDLEKLAAYRPLPRAEFVYSALKEALTNGRLQSGDRIREEEIARALSVSRTPVREALSRLSLRGLIEVAPGRGLVVARLDRQQILEIYILREIIEATATRLAAQHAAAIEIGHLRDLVKEFSASETDLDRLRQINRQFHHTIYEASHNRYLVQWLNEFRDTMALLPYTTYAASERFRSALDEHSMIVEAIEARDAEAAERAARLHVRNGKAQRLKMLFEAQAV